MKRFLLLLVVFSVVLNTQAQAARFPDIVEKEFVIQGQGAFAIMSFLGFPSDRDATYRLPWIKNTSICEAGNGKTKLCDPAVRVNTVVYKVGTTPRIIISGYWLDGETGSLPDVPKYSFQSPRLDSTELEDWSIVVSKQGKTLAPGNKSVEINTESVPLVRIKSFEYEGHITYYLGIDERLPADRKTADDEYKKCVKKLKGNFFKNLFFGQTTGSC